MADRAVMVLLPDVGWAKELALAALDMGPAGALRLITDDGCSVHFPPLQGPH